MIKAKKILVRSPNWVGDVVMATPAFRCIRENYADSHITLMIKGSLRGIIDNSPWFDDIIELVPKPKKSKNKDISSRKVFGKGTSEYLRLIQKLRTEKFDLGFIFPNSFSSASLLWLSGVKRRVGYKRDARSFFLTDGIERLSEDGKFKPTYMADYYLELCTKVGCKIKSKELELFISEECEEKANSLLKKYNLEQKPFILINPGASYGTSKCWTADGFARTADLLNESSGCSVVLVCGPGETKLTDDIEDLAKKSLINLSREFVPLDLLKALIKKCTLLATVDSGPRHFAVALKRPSVVLMGPTDPRYTESEYDIGKVIREDVDCSPCHIKTCPTDHRCMTMISPERVAQACMELLKG
ncbi:MAG: lipopolysaccharide heptosyltransferase II [Candidatus Brocadiaceae bacterium]|nr:lipopolysaccharide heptosyltransferase II [Candidatus Brocadiaceae bacterium]